MTNPVEGSAHRERAAARRAAREPGRSRDSLSRARITSEIEPETAHVIGERTETVAPYLCVDDPVAEPCGVVMPGMELAGQHEPRPGSINNQDDCVRR
jgi:hypothetical protein